MDNQEGKNLPELAKNLSEAAKNAIAIIDSILEPRGINLAIQEGHKKIIETYIERTDVDENDKIAFLAGYKRLIKEYKNCKKVANMAISQISENARPEDVDEDWFTFFFDKVRLVSDESVQSMWAKILSNEVEHPGSYSKSLLHTLSIMGTGQAALFCNIARFCMYDYRNEEIVHPLIFIATNVEAYNKSRIDSSGLVELEQLGLIHCDFKDEFVFLNKKILRYGNKVIEIYGDPNNENKINAGNVRFTQNGLTLFGIVESSFKRYRADILDFTISKLQHRNCRVIVNNKLIV